MRETIAQNLLQVQNMIEFGNYNEFEESNNNINNNNLKEDYDMNCFDLNKRILEKGQWVDVKDTIENWLEAQVIEVSEDKMKVKIHYNHWSSRWDEWIDTNSPRIMPFRYHTRQSSLTHYNSPFPNKKPDKGISLLSFENINKNASINPFPLFSQSNINSNNSSENNNINNNISQEKYNHIINNLGENGFIGIFKEFENINKVISGLSSNLLLEHDNKDNNIKENQKKFYYNLKKLIPILDRTGRIYSDISAFFEHAIENNYMEFISRNLFKDKRNIHEDIQYLSFEERKRISQEILGKNTEKENKSGTLNFIPPTNKFDTQLINNIPIIDTPYMIGKKDNHSNQSINSSNQNNNYLRNLKRENFNIEFQSVNNKEKEINLEDNNKNNNIIGKKTKRDNKNENEEDLINKKKK